MEEDKTNTTPLKEMSCKWVEFNEFGKYKNCVELDAWNQLLDIHPTLSFHERSVIFNQTYCKCCLEGQKIEIANNVLSTFCEVTGSTSYLGMVVTLVLDRLKPF